MNIVYVLGGIYCFAIFLYLVVALFAPEKF